MIVRAAPSSESDRSRAPRKRRSAPAAAAAHPPYSPDAADALREDLIRTAAYFRAERRGFAPGGELEDWFEAEREVDRWIESRGAPHRYCAPPR